MPCSGNYKPHLVNCVKFLSLKSQGTAAKAATKAAFCTTDVAKLRRLKAWL